MAELVKGLGVRWGVNGIAYTGGIVSATTAAKIQSMNTDRTSEKKDITNESGETVGQVFYNAKRSVTITVVPVGSSTVGSGLGEAGTSADAHMPAPGTKLDVTDSKGTIIDDSYNILSAKMRLSNTDVAMIDIELESFDANEVATAPITA